MHISSPTYTRVALMRTAKFLASSQHASFDSRSERETAQADSQTHTHTRTQTQKEKTHAHTFFLSFRPRSECIVSRPIQTQTRKMERVNDDGHGLAASLFLSLSLSHRLVVPLPYPWLAWMAVSGDQPKCGDATKSGQWEIRPKEETDIFTLGISRNSPGM